MSDPVMDAIIARYAPPRFRWLRIIGRTVVITLVLLIVLAGAIELLEPPFRLLFGWLFHLRNVLPALSWSLETVLCSLGALLLGVTGLHLLMPKLTGKPWPMRWSVAWCGLLTLLFATSIAAVGIVHQTGWLFRAPWFEDRSRSVAVSSISNAKQVVIACKIHAEENNGRWPDSLEALVQSGVVDTEKIFFSQVTRKQPPAPWIYLGAGVSETDDSSTVVLISSQTSPEAPMVVARLDGSAEYIAKTSELQKILDQLHRRPAPEQGQPRP